MKDSTGLTLLFGSLFVGTHLNVIQAQDSPTPAPTNNPTYEFCDIDYTVAVGIVVSNGCASTDYTCDDLIDFLLELSERVYNPIFTNFVLFQHNLSDSFITGEREQLLTEIESLSCGSGDNDEVDYDGEISVVLSDLISVKNSYDELKMVVISLCEAEVDDTTCDLADLIDPNGDIEITVINIGSDVSNNNQFSCLVNGDTSGTSGSNYNEYESINDAINDCEHLEEAICNRETSNPTPDPTPRPSGRPTPIPTTPNPTPMPTGTPTIRSSGSGSSSSSSSSSSGGEWTSGSGIHSTSTKTSSSWGSNGGTSSGSSSSSSSSSGSSKQTTGSWTNTWSSGGSTNGNGAGEWATDTNTWSGGSSTSGERTGTSSGKWTTDTSGGSNGSGSSSSSSSSSSSGSTSGSNGKWTTGTGTGTGTGTWTNGNGN